VRGSLEAARRNGKGERGKGKALPSALISAESMGEIRDEV